MKDLQQATERICDLKGSLVAIDALLTSLLQVLPSELRGDLAKVHAANAEIARTVLLNAQISDTCIASFEREVGRTRSLIAVR